VAVISGIIFSLLIFAADWFFLDWTNPFQISVSDGGLDLLFKNRKTRRVSWEEIKKIDRIENSENKDGKARIFYYKQTKITEKGYIIAIYNQELLQEIERRMDASIGHHNGMNRLAEK
jgi:hypothetical protein